MNRRPPFEPVGLEYHLKSPECHHIAIDQLLRRTPTHRGPVPNREAVLPQVCNIAL